VIGGIFIIGLNIFMVLFTAFDLNKERINDFLYCLEKNCGNRFIDLIYVFFDKDKGQIDVKNNKIRVHDFKTRPTITEFAQVANTRHANEIVMFANADIYFDDSLEKLTCANLNNVLVHLTRRELPGNPEEENFFRMKDVAADTWIFKAPLRARIDVPIGTLWCDHIIPQIAQAAGYKVIDPVLSVTSWHKHANRDLANKEKECIYRSGIWKTVWGKYSFFY
jgi:hypothetical protein